MDTCTPTRAFPEICIYRWSRLVDYKPKLHVRMSYLTCRNKDSQINKKQKTTKRQEKKFHVHKMIACVYIVSFKVVNFRVQRLQ